MSEIIKMEDLQEKAPTSGAEQAQGAESSASEAEQDPLRAELEKVQEKKVRSEAEKAAYSLRKNADRARELGIDPAEVLGFSAKDDQDAHDQSDDDAPVTMGMLKRMQQQTATKTALQLADEIPDATERELTRHHIENSIRPTGSPADDLALARAIVNAAKNRQIIDEMARKPQAKTHSSASGADARHEPEAELTQEELTFMQAPFNLSREEIVKSRKG